MEFFFRGHDLRFVVLAAVICLISAYACVTLARHAARVAGQLRMLWCAVSALVVGFGIWATHFIAMLAFRPGFELSYDLGLTAVSLLIAVIICGGGLALAIHGDGRRDHLLGGAVVGVGISAMHYVGIAALLLGGSMQWSNGLIGLSILAGIAFSAAALASAMGGGRNRVIGGAALLTLAICSMHFTAMGAADFSLCFPFMNVEHQIDSTLMSIAVALISLIILTAAFGGLLLDEADRRRTMREQRRQLEDAERLAEVSNKLTLALAHMGQGLVLFGSDARVQLHNERVMQMLDLPSHIELKGMHLDAICRMLLRDGKDQDDIESRGCQLAKQHLDMVKHGGGESVETVNGSRSIRVRHSLVGDGSWVTTIEDISERVRSEAAIAHLAQHDALTGLPNRMRFDQIFEEQLSESHRGDKKLAVIAIDLDRFKEINDSYGHSMGDAVLRTLAERLTANLAPGEVIARLGGDEFAALKSFTKMEGLREFLHRLEKAIFAKVVHDDVAMVTSGSIGVAIYPQDGTDRSKLLNNADLAMYRAKAEFDQRICYYEREMDEQARQRRAMARDLWTAVEENAFTLAYQVQKSISSGHITGYEVLLRWDRPGFGPVSPAEFIPVAEECGAIYAIGAWVLKTACEDAATWPEPYKIAVNVSGLQLAQFELVDMVKMVLMQSGLAPGRLELEVTETAIIADKKRALAILSQIRSLGVQIAIDDFGTGYSSLETLRSFPFDKIKLDRSFMSEVETNEQSKAIVRAILALGRSLRVPVLAEGVETRAQLDVLRDEGCNEAQGFLLGRPGRIDWADMLELPLRA
ncbi:bifunctional diguanylate cyclase/phosphodiesterase [Devosia equisanguinis]|nr:EAL domain-containing protein [Devosia equisanguinis]